jgi:hypothetical protein
MEIAPNAAPMSRPLFEKWAPIIDKFKSAPNTEIEIRFGRKAGKGFDTNVGRDSFERALRALMKYQEWESTKHTNSTIYYFAGDKRLSVDEDTDEQVGQIKKRVKVDDFSLDDVPFDVRLGVSTEEPFEYDGDETSTKQTTKERWSFVRKNLSIDMTIVKGTPDDKDSDEDTFYQIEMEIIDPKALTGQNETFNILHKVFDLLKCV